MPVNDGDRTKYFPAIEKLHGGPISLWLERLRECGSTKYPDQIALLRENFGFSKTHANALVMYARNSPTSRRFGTTNEYFASLEATPAATARAIFEVVARQYPELELVIAWNHPMMRVNGHYVIGLSVAKRHVLLNPFSGAVLAALADDLAEYELGSATFKVPLDWNIDERLLHKLVAGRLAELSGT